MTGSWVLGVDVGGSGSRLTLAPASASDGAEAHLSTRFLSGERARVTSAGSTVADVVASLIERATATWPEQGTDLAAIAVGATGLATLVADPPAVLAQLSTLHPAVPLAIATDAVTTHLGALGGEGGAVIAVGTGSIAFGTNLSDVWHRVDGWGHLLGDRGAGAWIGMEGLRAAMLTHDGVDEGGAALLEAAQSMFGHPASWPAQFYTRDDRAGELARFVPAVAILAASGDARATAILEQAGSHAARTLAAALTPGVPRVASTSGGVFTNETFASSFTAELGRLSPEVQLRSRLGTSVDGAVRLARMLTSSARPVTRSPYLWVSGPSRP